MLVQGESSNLHESCMTVTVLCKTCVLNVITSCVWEHCQNGTCFFKGILTFAHDAFRIVNNLFKES
jgi:hypothetical protein